MNREPRIFVSGHRNPDIDSIASAYALAELRRRQGVKQITAVCPGMLPERAAWLFKRFGVKPPDSRNDILCRLSDRAGDRCLSSSRYHASGCGHGSEGFRHAAPAGCGKG